MVTFLSVKVHFDESCEPNRPAKAIITKHVWHSKEM